MSLQEKIQALRKAVERKMVECPEEHLAHRVCKRCNENDGEAGRVSDPAFAGLLEVVTVKCPSLGKPHWHRGVHYRAVVLCPTDVWMTRSYDDQPEGSLVGALRYWVTQHITEQAKQSGLPIPTILFGDRMTDPQYIEWWIELRECLDDCFSAPNPDEAACEVVLAALAALAPVKV